MLKTTMAAMLVATFAGAAPVPAMQAESLVIASAEPVPTDRAALLRAQAEELYSQPRQWARAAGLLERSARAGGTSDANSYSSLMMAGRLRATQKDYAAARSNIEKAAEHALARGAVLDAAHALIDAAHLAAAERKPDAARELLDRAALLAESPLLAPAQADQITRRIRVK